MYQNEYEKMMEQFKKATEFAKDYSNILRCERCVQYYCRENAWQCLQDMIHEYGNLINDFGLLIDGRCVVRGIQSDQFSDEELRLQIHYISQHIPVYALLREGSNELAKQIGQMIDQRK